MIYIVAISEKEAQSLLDDGLVHGRNLGEALTVLEQIRSSAGPFYANQYKIFSFPRS